MEEGQQCQQSMFVSQTKRSSRFNKVIKFGDTVFSQQCIQDQINVSKMNDTISSPIEKHEQQFLFDDTQSKKSQAISFQSSSPREYPSTDGWETTSQNQLHGYNQSSIYSANSQKALSDRYLPLYILLKQLQQLETYNTFINTNTSEINILSKFFFNDIFNSVKYLKYKGTMENIIQSDDTCNQIKQKIYTIKNMIVQENTEYNQFRKFINQKYNNWKLKRWFASFKRKKTLQQKVQLLESIQTRKTICRICEKEILMQNLKKHSINCKQLNELNSQLKAQLKEMNSSLFYFFQQNRELQVQYTLVQKTLEKMIVNQQMIIEARSKNQASPRGVLQNSPRGQNKSSPKGIDDKQNNSQVQKRRFTCQASQIKSKEFSKIKTAEPMTPIIKFISQNVDINKEIMTNSEQLPPINGIADSSGGIDKSEGFKNTVDIISKSDKISRSAQKHQSIVIQQYDGEESQNDNIFSNSLPNFNMGKSNSSIHTQQDSKSQLNDASNEKSDRSKKLPDIKEEESVISPKDRIDSPVYYKNKEKYQGFDKIKTQQNNNDADIFSFNTDIKKVEDSQIDDQYQNKIQDNNYNDKKCLESCKESEEQSEQHQQQNDNNKLKEKNMKFQISQSKQLNGVPLITLNPETMTQFSLNSICFSNTNANYNKEKFNFDIDLAQGKDNNKIQKMLDFQQNEFNTSSQSIGNIQNFEKSPKLSYLPASITSGEISSDIKKVLNKQMINCEPQELQQNLNESVSPNLRPLLNNFLTVNQNNDSLKKSQDLYKQSPPTNSIIASSEIRNMYHQNNSYVENSNTCTINKLNTSQLSMDNHNNTQKFKSQLQTIKEQKAENDLNIMDYSLQKFDDDFNQVKNTIEYQPECFVPYQFSTTSVSSSLSEVDLMMADFFKKQQIKIENEKHLFNQNNTKQEKNVIDTNMQSQWGFSQEFSPKGQLLKNNINQSINNLKQDTLNCIEVYSSLNQFQNNSSSQSEQNNEKQNSNINKLSFQDEINMNKKQENNSQNHIISKININDDRFTMSNINCTNSMSVIYPKGVISTNLQIQQISPRQNEQKLQQSEQKINQEQTKIVKLQKQASIDCQSAHSSLSNVSPENTKQLIEKNQNKQETYSKKQLEQSNEIVQKGTTLSFYQPHSRKSIRLNTIDIVTNELADCFHTSQSSTSNQHIISSSQKEQSEELQKSSKFKESSGSSSSKSSGIYGSTSRTFQKQDLSTSGNTIQKQKSKFSQKFSRQRSESFNMSDDEMCRSEYIDQVPDISTQKLLKMKLNQKKSGFQQMDEYIYEEDDLDDKNSNSSIDRISNLSNKNIKGSNKNIKGSNKNLKGSSKGLKEIKEKGHRRHKYKKTNTSISSNSVGELPNQFTNHQIAPSCEVFDAKDLSYISKTSSSSSRSSRESSSQSQISESNDDISIDEKCEDDEFDNLQKQKAKTPQISACQFKRKKSKRTSI